MRVLAVSKFPNFTEGRERSPIGDIKVRPVLPILLVGNASLLYGASLELRHFKHWVIPFGKASIEKTLLLTLGKSLC